MTRHERFAAIALQGLIAARTNLDIEGEVEMAWRYADHMETVARLREAEVPGARAAARDAVVDAGNDVVEIVAGARYACALTHGLDAAVSENGDTFSDREARAIVETIGNFGLAVAAGADTTHQRYEMSGFQCPCRTYTFHVRAEGE